VVIVSDDHDMYAMVSIMRQARLMLSSRYHAIVTTMPGEVCRPRASPWTSASAT
jgi:hypothetical protein